MSNKIKVFREIHDYTAENFLYELEEKESRYENIVIEINSPGGSVVAAYAMFSAMLNSPARIDVKIVGVAASAASFLALAGNRVLMNDFALIMWHEAHYPGGKPDDKTARALEAFNNSIVEIYHKRTGKEKDVIRTFMKKETWFDASQALEEKLIDEILITGKQRPESVENYLKEFTNGPANVSQVYNLFTNFINPEKPMLDKIANLLNVSETGVLGAIENALAENKTLKADKMALETANESFKAQVEEAQNKLQEIEAARLAALATEAQAAVNAAVEAKKLSKESAAEWVELYKTSPSTVKNALAGLPSNPKLTDFAQNSDTVKPEGEKEFRARGASDVMREIANRQKAQ